MASSSKKVIVRTTDNAVVSGYLPGSGFVVGDGGGGFQVDLLDLTGKIQAIALETIRTIAFVRDFNLGQARPEGLERKTFLARPRSEGLWVRLTVQHSESAGEVLEGLAPLDAGLLDGMLEDRGLLLTPPDVRSNTQRLYVPRTAMRSVQVLAVITTPSKVKVAPVSSGDRQDRQEALFPDIDEG